MNQEYDLPNGDQRVQFSGRMLAKRSSQQGPEDLRWTEIEMYRTVGGKYIVHKTGRSVVWHNPGSQCASGTRVPFEAIATGFLPCPRCAKNLSAGAYVQTETDRHTVHVSESARGAVESCYTQDGDKVAYLTFPARQVLAEVSMIDEDIKNAFMVQRVD